MGVGDFDGRLGRMPDAAVTVFKLSCAGMRDAGLLTFALCVFVTNCFLVGGGVVLVGGPALAASLQIAGTVTTHCTPSTLRGTIWDLLISRSASSFRYWRVLVMTVSSGYSLPAGGKVMRQKSRVGVVFVWLAPFRARACVLKCSPILNFSNRRSLPSQLSSKYASRALLPKALNSPCSLRSKAVFVLPGSCPPGSLV